MFVKVTSGLLFAKLTSARLPLQPEVNFSIEVRLAFCKAETLYLGFAFLKTIDKEAADVVRKIFAYTELETLTSEIANDVVKRVTVYKDGGIEIELALRDELEKLLTCLETVDAAS